MQRNRDGLLRLAAEQLLYMELDLLDEGFARDELDIGWDGFHTEAWSILWQMERSGSQWKHHYERSIALISGGIGTMEISLGSIWTGSGDLETKVIQPDNVEYLGRKEGMADRWLPRRFYFDVFFFPRRLSKGESVLLHYKTDVDDPEKTLDPVLGYTPRNTGVELAMRAELPESLPAGSVTLRTMRGLPPHIEEIDAEPVEPVDTGIYEVRTTINRNPKNEEDLRYQLEFDKTAFSRLY